MVSYCCTAVVHTADRERESGCTGGHAIIMNSPEPHSLRVQKQKNKQNTAALPHTAPVHSTPNTSRRSLKGQGTQLQYRLGGTARAMSNKATTEAIQKDWKEREMIEIVHLNILKVSSGNKISSLQHPALRCNRSCSKNQRLLQIQLFFAP